MPETESDEESEREIDDVIDSDYQGSSKNGSEDDEVDSLQSYVNQATSKSTPASNFSRKTQNSSGKKSTPRIPVVTACLPSGYKRYIIEGTSIQLLMFCKRVFKGS